jgi:hypothetical protein
MTRAAFKFTPQLFFGRRLAEEPLSITGGMVVWCFQVSFVPELLGYYIYLVT